MRVLNPQRHTGIGLAVAAVALGTLSTVAAANQASPHLVADTRAAIAGGDLPGAERLAAAALARTPGDPEALLALSWVGRGALAASQFDMAARVARDTERGALDVLRTRRLDQDTALPLALGAAYEVQAQALARQGARSEALLLLNRALRRFGSTSIHDRLQKNVHLISLTGQPMPRLATDEYLTTARLAPARGRPTLLFFWAHWCGDCKAFAKTLAVIQREFADRGLLVVAPTQRYGYIGTRDDVPPGEEVQHIREIQREFYPTLAGLPIPLSPRNFATYGVSTTPTLVLVDGTGRVRRYHPGAMTAADLRRAVASLF